MKTVIEQSGDWSNLDNVIELEALLFVISFCIQLIDKNANIQDYDEGISFVIQLTSKKQNMNYSALRRAVIDILYILAEFYDKIDQETLKTIMEYVVEGFNNKSTFDISSQGFERIILYNIESFKDSLDEFVIYLKTFAENLDTFNPLRAKSFTSVLTLACQTYGASPQEFKLKFEQILETFAAKLGTPNCSENEARISLEYLAELFNTIDEQIKVYGTIKAVARESFILIWPLIFQFIENYSSNEKLFEACTRLVKKGFRAGSDRSDALDQIAQQYLDKVIESFRNNPASWLIYPIEIMLPIFSHRPSFKEAFYEIIDILINTTFKYIDTIDKVKAEPFLATDLFSGISKTLKHRPQLIFGSKSLINLVEFSILGCEIQHQDLSTKCGIFQSQLFYVLKDVKEQRIDMGIPDNQLADTAEAIFGNGKVIFQKYIEVILNVPIAGVLENIVDFISNVVEEFPDQAIQWLDDAINDIIPSDCLSEAEKQDFCKDFNFGRDSTHTIHKSFTKLAKRCSRRMLRGVN